jgi:hypothetical protein
MTDDRSAYNESLMLQPACDDKEVWGYVVLTLRALLNNPNQKTRERNTDN